MTLFPPLQAVLFDLDGTLLDTAPDFALVVNQLLLNHGKPALDFSSIRTTVSHGARALITLAFELQEGEQGFEELRLELLNLYSNNLAVKTRLFSGMDESLQWLEANDLPWGIVTNKPRVYAQAILDSLDLAQRCQTLVCPEDVSNTKPDPEPLYLACQQLARSAAHSIYIGDHRRDIEAGNNAGMKTIAANYGYIDPSDPAIDWQADFSIDHASDIIPLLQTHFFS